LQIALLGLSLLLCERFRLALDLQVLVLQKVTRLWLNVHVASDICTPEFSFVILFYCTQGNFKFNRGTLSRSGTVVNLTQRHAINERLWRQ
jgi:hypothetical protein